MAVKFRLETNDVKTMLKAGCVWFAGKPYAKNEGVWVPVNHSVPWNSDMARDITGQKVS